MKLSTFKPTLDRGAPAGKEAIWLFAQAVVASWLPGSGWRRLVLKGFGARLGSGVVIKPRVRVKFPWKLVVGDDCWLGEAAWIDNLETVEIGHDTCISQDVYLCTGNHDWTSDRFDLASRPIRIGPSAWIAARSIILPGSEIGEGAVIAAGAVFGGTAEPWTIYRGNPATAIGPRRVADAEGSMIGSV